MRHYQKLFVFILYLVAVCPLVVSANDLQSVIYEKQHYGSLKFGPVKTIKLPENLKTNLSSIDILDFPENVAFFSDPEKNYSLNKDELQHINLEQLKLTYISAKLRSSYPMILRMRLNYSSERKSWSRNINYKITNFGSETIKLTPRNQSKIVLSERRQPWGSIVKITNNKGGICTGFFVGPNIIATAQHCVYNFLRAKVRSPEELRIKTMAAPRLQLNPIKIIINPLKKLPEKPLLTDLAHDWAFIELSEFVGEKIGYFPIRSFQDSKLEFLKIGYGTGVDLGLYAEGPCSIKLSHLYRDIAYHDCPGFDGDSGGPLLALIDGQPAVVGIHVARFKKEDQRFGVVRLFPEHFVNQANTLLRMGLKKNQESKAPTNQDLENYQSNTAELFHDIVNYLKAVKVLDSRLDLDEAMQSFLQRKTTIEINNVYN